MKAALQALKSSFILFSAFLAIENLVKNYWRDLVNSYLYCILLPPLSCQIILSSMYSYLLDPKSIIYQSAHRLTIKQSPKFVVFSEKN